jgi:hypothetical protein
VNIFLQNNCTEINSQSTVDIKIQAQPQMICIINIKRKFLKTRGAYIPFKLDCLDWEKNSEIERGAMPNFAFDPNSATHHVD